MVRLDSQVVDIKDYGIFVEFGLDAQGFIHVSDFDLGHEEKLEDYFESGEIIKCEIVSFAKVHN